MEELFSSDFAKGTLGDCRRMAIFPGSLFLPNPVNPAQLKNTRIPGRSGRPSGPYLRLALVVFMTFVPAAAHDLYRSESRLEVRGREVRAAFTFNLLDFPGVDQNGDKRISQEEFDAAFDRVYAGILQHYSLDSSGPPSRITRERDRVFDEHVLDLNVTYTFPQDVLGLKVHSTLTQILGKDHIHLVTFILNRRVQEAVLTSGHEEAFFTQTSGSNLQTFLRFV